MTTLLMPSISVKYMIQASLTGSALADTVLNRDQTLYKELRIIEWVIGTEFSCTNL